MGDPSRTTEASRFMVLVVGLVCVALAGVVYVAAGPSYLIGVSVLLAIGLAYVGMFVFAPTKICQNAVLVLTVWTWFG